MSKTTANQMTCLPNARKELKNSSMKLKRHPYLPSDRHTAKLFEVMEKCDFLTHYAATKICCKNRPNVNANKDTLETIRNVTKQTIDAYQNQNKFIIDSNYTTNNMFDAFNENTKTSASLSKNTLDLMLSTMKKT